MRCPLTVLLLTATVLAPPGAALAGAAAAPTCFGHAATIVAEPGEEVRGTGGDDVIVGGADVYGGPGDDRFCGFTGKAHGNDGRDRFEVLPGAVAQGGHSGDRFVTLSEPGEPPVRVWAKAGPDVVHGGRGPDFVFTGVGADTVRGGAGADRIHLNWGRNVAHGGPGDDDIVGHIKDDRLFGGPGDDELYGGGHVADHDLGDGGRGRDTCGDIERRVSCEVVE